MGIVAILVTIATIIVGVLAFIGARGLWRGLAVVTLCLNAGGLATLVVVALLDRANTARKSGLAGSQAQYERWSEVWYPMAVWSMLDLLVCLIWGLALAVAALVAMTQLRTNPDAMVAVRTRDGWAFGRVLRLVLAHAVLTIGLGLATFVWIVPYAPRA